MPGESDEKGKQDFHGISAKMVDEIFKSPTFLDPDTEVAPMAAGEVKPLSPAQLAERLTVPEIGFLDQPETTKLFLVALFRAAEATREYETAKNEDKGLDVLEHLKEIASVTSFQLAALSEMIEINNPRQEITDLIAKISIRIHEIDKEIATGQTEATTAKVQCTELLLLLNWLEGPSQLEQYYKDNFKFQEYLNESDK